MPGVAEPVTRELRRRTRATIGSERHAVIRAETIVSIAINALGPTAVIWALGVTPPATLTGRQGLVAALAKGSGLSALMMTLLVTLVVRRRVRARPSLALARAELPAMIRTLPAGLVARAVAVSLFAMIVLVPAGTAVAMLLRVLPLDVTGLAILNILLGTAVGLTMAPVVVLRAFADGRR